MSQRPQEPANSTRAADPASASFTLAEMQNIADTLSLAMDDIRELLQVAKYNLRGQINTGEIIDKPDPPILVHEQGIRQSEAVIERCRETWLKVWQRIQTVEAGQREAVAPGVPAALALRRVKATEAVPNRTWYRHPSWGAGHYKRFLPAHTMAGNLHEFEFYEGDPTKA